MTDGLLTDIASPGGGREGLFLRYDEPLAGHSTIGIGGTAALWIDVRSPGSLVEAVSGLMAKGAPFRVVGNGSNILFGDGAVKTPLIRLDGPLLAGLRFDGDTLIAGGGCDLRTAIGGCLKIGLKGLEGLAGIPATVGGAVVSNASYVTSAHDRLVEVTVLNQDLEFEKVGKKYIEAEYRRSSLKGRGIVTEAVFELEKDDRNDIERRLRRYARKKAGQQPLSEKTLGCIFRNPREGASSGRLIDMLGMKGRARGGIHVSEKHANFFVNSGGGTAGEMVSLMEEIRSMVEEKFGILLEPEIEIVD